MRIALFGGSFDPPHLGHVAIARAAAREFQLDRILFAPAGRQPLKPEGPSATYEQRFTMTALACADSSPVFEASELDAPHPDGSPNYTIDTLQALAFESPGATIFNLAGADSFQHIARWRSPQRLVELAQWIVVSRPGIPLRIPEALQLTPAQRSRVHLLGSVHEEVSATSLRQRLATGDPCTDLLPPSVAAYIRDQHLYLHS